MKINNISQAGRLQIDRLESSATSRIEGTLPGTTAAEEINLLPPEPGKKIILTARSVSLFSTSAPTAGARVFAFIERGQVGEIGAVALYYYKYLPTSPMRENDYINQSIVVDITDGLWGRIGLIGTVSGGLSFNFVYSFERYI